MQPSRRRPGRFAHPAPAPTLLLLAVLAGCAAAPPSAPGTADATGATGATGATTSEATPPPPAPDDLPARLRDYLRLLAPGGAPADDYLRFLAANPVWPNRPALAARYDAALVREPDPATRARLCAARPPLAAAALAACADATGDPADARAAWRAGYDGAAPDAAAAFRARWGREFTRGDAAARFAVLLGRVPLTAAEAAAAADQLAPDDAALARARLLLASGPATDPLAILAAVPVARRGDPALVLAVARALRRNGGGPAPAAQFWATVAGPAEATVAVERRGPFWTERARVARALLASGVVAGARALADDRNALPPDAEADALFLEGWIALRFAHDPAAARDRFVRLAALGEAVITRARAAYWLARADAASGDVAGSEAALREAASFPTTFYGQRALAARPGGLADGLAPALRRAEPAAPSPTAALAFADETLPRAAILLAAWGERRRARAFIDLADRRTTDGATHVLAARLALALELPDEAVTVARRAGRDGTALPSLGWPAPFDPPAGVAVPPSLVLAVARQESGFDPDARSPTGALGLMQLEPATASELAARSGIPFSAGALVADPSLNLRLGADYLAAMLARAGGNVPLALAAYNAGPHRAASWPPPPSSPQIAAGDTVPIDDATLDWIETIPVDETRNYVERVLENQAVYAAAGRPAARLLAEAGAAAGGGS